jgi:hypothetical protein
MTEFSPLDLVALASPQDRLNACQAGEPEVIRPDPKPQPKGSKQTNDNPRTKRGPASHSTVTPHPLPNKQCHDLTGTGCPCRGTVLVASGSEASPSGCDEYPTTTKQIGHI